MTQTLELATKEDIARLERRLMDFEAKLDGCRITPPPEWLGIKQAATALGVSPDTIRRRINNGQLQARGNGRGRQVLVKPSP